MELLPCPFCGGKATFDHDDNGWYWIVCEKCGTATNSRTHTMEDCHPLLAEQWNRRASPASVPEGLTLDAIYAAWHGAGVDIAGGNWKRFVVMLAAAPTPPVSEWIDVSKQLPSDGDDVLCALTDGCVRVLEFNTHPEKRFIDRDTGKWWWIKVGHWMPLPKAPAMQEDKL